MKQLLPALVKDKCKDMGMDIGLEGTELARSDDWSNTAFTIDFKLHNKSAQLVLHFLESLMFYY